MPLHLINGRLFEERDGAYHPVPGLETLPVPDYAPSVGSQPAGAFVDDAMNPVPRLDGGMGLDRAIAPPPMLPSATGTAPDRRVAGPTNAMKFAKALATAPRLGDPSMGQRSYGAGQNIAQVDKGNRLINTPAAADEVVIAGGGAYDRTAHLPLSDETLASLRAGASIESRPFVGVTADQIRKIMPNSGKRADQFVDPLNAAMEARGIRLPSQQAAFLAQISAESGDLAALSENPNYSPQQMMKFWPKRFPDIKTALRYKGKPEAILNHAYAGIIDNGDEASGDGYRFRGGGLIQTTGRGNYRAAGFENNPDALRTPPVAADSAAQYWAQRDLNKRSATQLERPQFDDITGRINAGRVGADRRWAAYLRGLSALGVTKGTGQ